MKGNLKAIIVDDEESARDVLANLLKLFCPQIDVVGVETNVPDAVKLIKTCRPDVVFLDIEMPNYAGYEIVSFFEKIDFEIIFVTAYDKYAVRAFEVSAVDYLLKPVEISRLKNAVSKLSDKTELKHLSDSYRVLTENMQSEELSRIIVRHNGSQKIINTKEVVTIEANQAYSIIHTDENKYLMSKNLKYFEKILEGNRNFFRSHKSWIVNRDYIKSFSKSKLEILLNTGMVAKLSKQRKSEFEKLLIK